VVITSVACKIIVLRDVAMHSLIHRYRYVLETVCASIVRVYFPALKKKRAPPPKTMDLSAEFHGAANRNLLAYLLTNLITLLYFTLLTYLLSYSLTYLIIYLLTYFMEQSPS